MRRGWVLVAAVVLGGCQCNREKKDAPASPVASKAASTGAPDLSALRPARGGSCEWLKLDPVAKTETVVASVDAPCEEMNVSWSHDGARAILWVPVTYAGDKPRPARAWEVAIGGGAPKPLDLPTGLEDLGYDATGAIVALVAEELTDQEMRSGTLVRDGKTYRLEEGQEGLPILVHARRRENGKWKTVESKLSDTGWDLAMGIDALDASRGLGPTSDRMLYTRGNSDIAKQIEDDALAAKLKSAVPFADDEFAVWTVAGTPHGPVYLLEECFEVACAFRRIAFPAGDSFTPAPGFAFSDQEPFEAFLRGPWLLAVTPDGTNAHLWDLRTRSLAWRDADGALSAAVFWP